VEEITKTESIGEKWKIIDDAMKYPYIKYLFSAGVRLSINKR
jgi:hypothetical protein